MPKEPETVSHKTKREAKKSPGNIVDSHVIFKKHHCIRNFLLLCLLQAKYVQTVDSIIFMMITSGSVYKVKPQLKDVRMHFNTNGELNYSKAHNDLQLCLVSSRF